jgi:antitoxin MazE
MGATEIAAENKRTYKRYIEILNTRNFGALSEVELGWTAIKLYIHTKKKNQIKVSTCYNNYSFCTKEFSMETSIVKIGNSQGLIIPKRMLNTLGEGKLVDIQVKDGGLFITPLTENKARSNWEVQFTLAIANGYEPESESNHIENEFDK